MKPNTKNLCANVNQIKTLNNMTSEMTVFPDIDSVIEHSPSHPPHQAFALPLLSAHANEST